MNVEDALRDLLPMLYAAPLEPPKWQVFLDRLSHLTEIPSGYLISSTPSAGNVCLAGGGAEFDPEALSSYNEQYGANDPFRVGFLARPRLGVIDGNELVSRANLEKTELWNELLFPHGLHQVTMLCGECNDSGIQVLSLWRHSRQGPPDYGSLQLLQALSPHVQTALRLSRRLQATESTEALSETALNAMDMAVVLVDERSRVQHMNLNAARRIPDLIGLGIQSGRLVAEDTGDDARLQALIKRATEKPTCETGSRSGGAMRISRPLTAEKLQVSVIPASEHTRMSQCGRRAVIFIGEPQAAARLRGEVLRELYRLTATEARLADCLLEGKDLRGAAEQLSIKWATARFHLKRVFAKTGTRRQTELMRLMLALPASSDRTYS